MESSDLDYLLLPMQNMAVPQEGQIPLVAGLPFFMVTALALFISFLARHFTQYASIFHPHLIRSLFYINRGNLFLTGSSIFIVVRLLPLSRGNCPCLIISSNRVQMRYYCLDMAGFQLISKWKKPRFLQKGVPLNHRK